MATDGNAIGLTPEIRRLLLELTGPIAYRSDVGLNLRMQLLRIASGIEAALLATSPAPTVVATEAELLAAQFPAIYCQFDGNMRPCPHHDIPTTRPR